MDLQLIRMTALVAIAADDVLCKRLVLKGGTALELVHRIGNRGSLDLDFSMDGDLDDLVEIERRLKHTVEDRFDAAGYMVFDTSFTAEPRPRQGDVPAWWGGYKFCFKLISREEYKRFAGKIDSLRRRAVTIDEHQHRVFEIQISKAEYCRGSETKTIDNFELRVYTLAMIACEKIRAICQQMPEYPMCARQARSPRARDFYDVHALVSSGAVDFSAVENREMLKAMFAAKQVPLALLDLIAREREFHRQDWPRVVNAVRGRVESFDYYFDFVLGIIAGLQASGIVDPP